ncbi:MAG TPA: DNA primase [Clostridiales bacterium]|nr:MAG: DNA primase [Clostridiales bacterium GWD2_32_59]HAN09899.1 DNA primase [Clostridiales bacterium]
MFYPDEVIEEVRRSNDVADIVGEYVRLIQKGNSYSGLCPFHNEKTPSFYVNRDKQIYHCFGCGAGGNVVSFIMQIENLSFVEAIKYLAEKANIKLPEAEISLALREKIKQKELLIQINIEAAKYFYKILKSDYGKNAKEYLDKRKINETTLKSFGLGYALNNRNSLSRYIKDKHLDEKLAEKAGLIIKDSTGYHDRFWDRVIFPIFDVHDKVIGFGGRIIDKGEPKYLNSPETDVFNKRLNLYGLNIARKSRKSVFLIVEGYMDVISLHQAGYTNAVASLGTALTREQALLLRRYVAECIIIYDSDKAGTTATLRAIPILKSVGMTTKVLQVTDAKDPDEYINKFGMDAFESLLANAMDYADFQIKIIKSQFNMSKQEDKIKAIKKIIEYANELENELEKQMYMKKISDEFGIEEKVINGQAQITNINLKSTKKSEQKPEIVEVRNIPKIYEKRERILLSFMINSKDVFDKVIDLLGNDIFIVDLHKNIFEKTTSMYYLLKNVDVAQFINYFPDLEEQKKVNTIINEIQNFDEKEYEKILNEQLKIIANKIIDFKINDITNKLRQTENDEKKRLEEELTIWLVRKTTIKKIL